MSIKDKLQIILITYNRENHLKNTLNQLFSDNSPIRDFDITVLDNASTDGTTRLIQEWQKNFPNLKHIIHPKNIGVSANICRAFETGITTGKDYLWVLCDDDNYDWTHWDEVESAIRAETDVIVVQRISQKSQQLSHLLNELCFLPSGIYKTSNITSSVLQNMNILTYTVLPHLGIFVSCANQHCKFYYTKENIVLQNTGRNVSKDAKRGLKEGYIRQTRYNLFAGMINGYTLLEDKKLRYDTLRNLSLGDSSYGTITDILNANYPMGWYNFCDILGGIFWRQKILFLVGSFFHFLPFKFLPLYFKFTSRKVDLILFYKIKIRIWHKKWKK